MREKAVVLLMFGLAIGIFYERHMSYNWGGRKTRKTHIPHSTGEIESNHECHDLCDREMTTTKDEWVPDSGIGSEKTGIVDSTEFAIEMCTIIAPVQGVSFLLDARAIEDEYPF